VGFALNAAFGPSGLVLNMSDRNRLLLLNVLTAVGLNIALNFALIPVMGMEGAAVAWIASLMVLNVLALGEIVITMKFNPVTREQVRTVLALSIVLGLQIIASYMWTTWLWPILIGLVGYPLAAFLTRTPNEAGALRGLFAQRRVLGGAL
jgi:O-antigen/teichoic acid export membrane protein